MSDLTAFTDLGNYVAQCNDVITDENDGQNYENNNQVVINQN